MRHGVLALILLSTALLALVPTATAQGSCGLELAVADENPSPSGFSEGETRRFSFEITNPNQLEADGRLVLNDPRPGWFWTTQPWSGSVAGGDSQVVNVSLSYEGGGSSSAFLEARLEQVECSGPLTVGGVDGSEGSPATLSLSGQPAAGPGADDGTTLWPWILFGVIVLGTAIAVPVYYQRGRVAIEAHCEEPEREVVAGRGTSFPIVLRNKASEAAHVSLEVTDVKEGWSALTTLPDLELGPKESRTIYMMVRAPDQARSGDMCVAKLQAKPEGGSAQTVKTVSRVSQSPGTPKAPSEDEETPSEEDA